MEEQTPLSDIIINFAGEKVALGPNRRDLVPLYQRWINDFEVTRTLGVAAGPVTLESEQSWYSNIGGSSREVGFTIYEKAAMRPIGGTGLHDIDYRQRTAEFGILIGEKECWGKGYGTEVAALMLDYGFNALDLHNIMLRVYSNNPRGVSAYTRAGFKLVGRRRQARRIGGHTHDVILMDCLATEFTSPTLAQLLE